MEKQASGMISLDAHDAASRARGMCKYQAGAKANVQITASQLPESASYIAVIWTNDRPAILGELKKTQQGWSVQGGFVGSCIDAAFVARQSGGGLSVVLAGRAMGAQLDMEKALFQVRMMKTKKKAQKRTSGSEPTILKRETAHAPAVVLREEAPKHSPAALLPKEAPKHPAAAPPPHAEPVKEECPCEAEEGANTAAPRPVLERFIASGQERSIAPRHAAKAEPAPKPPHAKQPRRPEELLRRERPSYSRAIGNPFPGRYPGAKWVLARYPGAQHPHYLAGRWLYGGRDLLVSAVPGENAPQPPSWLGGFSKHRTARWGQGYWIGVTDYRTGKPWEG